MEDGPAISDIPVGINATGVRRETDSMGVVEVPADRYWGAQTERSLRNFAIGGERMPIEVYHALGLVKKAAALVNGEAGRLPSWKADLIVRVADEVVRGELDEDFPLSLWQTGSGTQTNMNVNEVISNRAIQLAGGELGSKKPVHPNDDVNMGQSSNDTFPTAMHIATVRALRERVLPQARGLRDTVSAKAKQWYDVTKTGRTHLQDAVPLTVGQEWSGYAAQLTATIDALEHSVDGLHELAIGGTAVGTGLNAPPGFAEAVAARIAAETGHPYRSAPNKFAALAGADAMAAASAGLRGLAAAVMKFANDLRWLASGPRCGLGELVLPPNEPGSSIMPGKVNPTQCEAAIMVCLQVLGNDATVASAAAQGNLELNTMRPLIAGNVLRSANILGDACGSLDVHCVRGTELNRERIDELTGRSLMLVTALSPAIGYDKAAEIAHKASAENTTLREAAIASGYIAADEFDRVVDPARMTGVER
ncbi:MAG: class II fumarate hydratase [Streptosporangiaceae bacterium]|jgi:fumarate hydratase class II